VEESFDFLQGMTMRQFLLSTLRGFLPGLLFTIVGTVAIYALLSPHFPSTSIVPLLLASLVPVSGNIISVVRHRRLDIFGLVMLIGLTISIIALLLGGSPRLLLIRESFTSGAIGLALLVSMVLPRSLGYYFARQFMTANDPRRIAAFQSLWQAPFFRKSVQSTTLFWGILLLSDVALRVLIVFTLPVILVLTIAPIISNILIVSGIIVSTFWVRSILLCIKAKRKAA
jgi:hypothetical protein